MAQIRGDRRIPLLDVGTVAAIRRGEIEALPGVESFDSSSARFTDGKDRGFNVVPTGMLREISREARRIARIIAGRSP